MKCKDCTRERTVGLAEVGAGERSKADALRAASDEMVSPKMAMASGDVSVKNSDSHVHELSSLGLFDDLLSLRHPDRVVVLAERDETDGIEIEVEACAFGQGERNEMARTGRQLSILRPEEGDPIRGTGRMRTDLRPCLQTGRGRRGSRLRPTSRVGCGRGRPAAGPRGVRPMRAGRTRR